ncbi:peptidase S8/S53 domain-containing protein [Kockovaella imperatae]|uniref:Peptidase S8/S53 domain-containing protein n=1 Tax=Kockovaella imperatae TaxID=4999 RepID=A0A1Y1UCP0_9TREE|nr:peptidase S8/S53 domain-containing protein [Kockovaella imperatae]ORX35284.1 peptidase S8/S53 domain-containing protein [Kockovaella imperatae]
MLSHHSAFRLLSLLVLVALTSPSTFASASTSRPHARTYDTHQYYALELRSTSTPYAESIASSLGVELVEKIGELDDHWLVRRPGSTVSQEDLSKRSYYEKDPILERWDHLRSLTPRGQGKNALKSLQPLSLRRRAKRLPAPMVDPDARPIHLSTGMAARQDTAELSFAQGDIGIMDPMLNLQWHLINTELKDVELNVTGLWARGITGKGVRAVVVDDGLDLNSDDLHDNFYADGSWDFNDHTNLPLPRLSDDQHGTRCAGEISAVKNDVCGVGVAYESQIAGVRILSGAISDADEAAALNYHYQENDIYSCSWGPPDDGKSMDAPEGVILKAFVNGVQRGRGGKGSIFVFAAGNGGGSEDQCNFDGYTNSIFSITVGAVDRKGLHPYYSELCAAMMVVAPSSGSGDHIHTTDVGKNKCAHTHGGTSAAAPLGVGVFALALQVRPELTWRDMQHICVRTGVHFNPDDPDWQLTAAGRWFSYKYGYGRLDAGRVVDLAQTWKLVKPQAWFDSPAIHLPSDASFMPRQIEDVPGQQDDNGEGADPTPVIQRPGTTITSEGIKSSFEVTQQMLDDSNFETLEHVTVRVWIEHERRGDVEVEIMSPNGISSVLARRRRYDEDRNGFPGWKFMSLKHWEESPVGTWTITVYDRNDNGKSGRLISWALQLWGECQDASLAKMWAPAEEGQPDEEQIGSDPTPSVTQKPKPTAHLPEDHGSASGEADRPGLGDHTDGDATGNADATDPSEPVDDTDGTYWHGIEALAKDKMWLGGSAVIVLFAASGLGLFFFIRARRRRNRNLFGMSNNGQGARGAYAPVNEDVPMGLLERGRRKLGGGSGGGVGAAAGSKELYDAFGDGPSDESDVDDSPGLDERTALRYHDDFLEDDPRTADPPSYRDEPEHEEKGAIEGGRLVKREQEQGGTDRRGEGESNSGSSSSWQDAAEDVRGV